MYVMYNVVPVLRAVGSDLLPSVLRAARSTVRVYTGLGYTGYTKVYTGTGYRGDQSSELTRRVSRKGQSTCRRTGVSTHTQKKNSTELSIIPHVEISLRAIICIVTPPCRLCRARLGVRPGAAVRGSRRRLQYAVWLFPCVLLPCRSTPYS